MSLRAKLDEAIAPLHLLHHPFYQAWTEGTLPKAKLQRYARQYFHHVRAFPTYVSGLHSRCGDDLVSRQSLLENLVEEERGPRNHAMLWEQFAGGVGVASQELHASSAEPATRNLIGTFQTLTRAAPAVGAAALYAYESQVPAIAAAKIAGLRAHFGVTSPEALAFFTVHQEVDEVHAGATAAIVDRHPETSAELAIGAAEEAALALWHFLDSVV